jgi:hypothetical protein
VSLPTLRLFDGYPRTSPELAGDVAHLQRELAAAGFKLKIDGLFGPEVQAAVKSFQDSHGLDSDGIVGKKTWIALLGDSLPPNWSDFPTTYSRADARLTTELAEAALYRAIVADAVEQHKLHPAILGGIGSRESRWGLALSPPGPSGVGDGGHGRGLMQIDDRAHPAFTSSDAWRDPKKNIDYACRILNASLDVIGRRTDRVGEELLRAGIAGYNCGPGNVLKALQQGRSVDYFTAGRDYSSDVLSRAGWFGAHVGFREKRAARHRGR